MYDTTSQLKSLLQEEVSDTSPNSDTAARYLALLDRAHKAIVGGGGELNLDDRNNPIRRPVVFPWALATQPKSMILLPKQEGTANVTQLSATALVCSINSSTTNMTGWHIRFDQLETVYYITLHTGTTLTLDSAYIGETGTSTVFEAGKLIYSLGSNDILLLTDKGNLQTNDGKLSITDRNALAEAFPIYKVTQKTPTQAGILNQTNGTFSLQMGSWPPEYKRVDFPYVPIPADLDLSTSNPIIPNGSGHRIVIVHLAAFYHLRKRDDDRAQEHFKTAQQLFNSLTTESYQNVNSNDVDYGHLSPWAGGFDGSTTFGDILIQL